MVDNRISAHGMIQTRNLHPPLRLYTLPYQCVDCSGLNYRILCITIMLPTNRYRFYTMHFILKYTNTCYRIDFYIKPTVNNIINDDYWLIFFFLLLL